MDKGNESSKRLLLFPREERRFSYCREESISGSPGRLRIVRRGASAPGLFHDGGSGGGGFAGL